MVKRKTIHLHVLLEEEDAKRLAALGEAMQQSMGEVVRILIEAETWRRQPSAATPPGQ